MIEHFFAALEHFSEALWGSVGVALVVGVGTVLFYQLRWFNPLSFMRLLAASLRLLVSPRSQNTSGESQQQNRRGVSPARAFFASLGGCIGIGNLAGVAMALQIGGPGVLLWMWIVALLGMALKYGEVYLGMLYRQPNSQGSYDGGPMYVIAQAFPVCRRWLPHVVAGLMCVYGVEIYVFGVIQESVSVSWGLPSAGVATGLLVLIIFGAAGGVKRIGAINAFILPLFGLMFLGMTLTILVFHVAHIPELMGTVVRSAFCGHEAVGSFAGSVLILTISRGLSVACYSGDVGIGYASIIHSESQELKPARQAALSMLGIGLDMLVCTCVVLLLLVTGVWTQNVSGSLAVQTALSQYFPYMHVFMPIFVFCLGYTTISAYMIAGIKSARFLSPSRGNILYWIYAIAAFVVFSVVDARHAFVIMSLAGAFLMIINCTVLLRLRRSITSP